MRKTAYRRGKISRMWLIPKDAKKPIDSRLKANRKTARNVKTENQEKI